MLMHAVIGLSLLAGALAQAPQQTDVERVDTVLRSADPLVDGKAAATLLGPGVSLEAAIAQLARGDKTTTSCACARCTSPARCGWRSA